MTKALVLIDIQNDYFAGGAFPLPNMEQAAKNAAKVLAYARNSKWKILHIQHEESDPATGFFLQGTTGVKINSIVAPLPGEPVIVKKFPNSFRGTNLTALLEGTHEVIIVGAMSNMCIDATARAAFDLGFAITVVEDACAACDLEFRGAAITASVVHGSFMAALASAYGQVVGTEVLIRGC